MRPFFLLGDITGSLVLLGGIILAIGIVLLLVGRKMLQANPENIANRIIAATIIVAGSLASLIAYFFLSDVLS